MANPTPVPMSAVAAPVVSTVRLVTPSGFACGCSDITYIDTGVG